MGSGFSPDVSHLDTTRLFCKRRYCNSMESLYELNPQSNLRCNANEPIQLKYLTISSIVNLELEREVTAILLVTNWTQTKMNQSKLKVRCNTYLSRNTAHIMCSPTSIYSLNTASVNPISGPSYSSKHLAHTS